jgi:hypothetical protein
MARGLCNASWRAAVTADLASTSAYEACLTCEADLIYEVGLVSTSPRPPSSSSSVPRPPMLPTSATYFIACFVGGVAEIRRMVSVRPSTEFVTEFVTERRPLTRRQSPTLRPAPVSRGSRASSTKTSLDWSDSGDEPV